MPTYGYECLSCKNEFEVFQSIKDDPLTTCETCGGTLRKRMYPVGIAFKGSGFYVNDYAAKSESGSKSDSGSKPESGASETKTPESAKTETTAEAPKTEAKSETKTETKAPAAAA